MINTPGFAECTKYWKKKKIRNVIKSILLQLTWKKRIFFYHISIDVTCIKLMFMQDIYSYCLRLKMTQIKEKELGNKLTITSNNVVTNETDISKQLKKNLKKEF